MARPSASAATLIVCLTAFLAGCAEPSDDAMDGMDGGDGMGAMMYDHDSFHMTAADVPQDVATGETFTFNMKITGMTAHSDHVGAHYWDFATDDPTGDFSQSVGGCVHDPAGHNMPATVEVQCTIDAAGTYALYGHMRMMNAGTQWNYWTDAHAIDVHDAMA